MKQIILFVLTFLVSTSIQSQSEIDAQKNLNIDSLITHLDIDTSGWHNIQAEINAVPPMDTVTLDQSLDIAKDTAYASKLLNESIGLMNMHNYDLAYLKADSARQIYILRIGYECKEVAHCLNQFGRTNYLENDFSNSIKFYKKALAIMLKKYTVANSYAGNLCYNIGLSYFQLEQYDSTILYNRNALFIKTIKPDNDFSAVIASYFEIGKSYMNIGNLNSAIEYLQKSLQYQLIQDPHDSLKFVEIFLYIAHVHYFKGEFNKAEKYILKSLEINHKANGNQLNSALLYTFLGGIYEEYGNYNKSIELHQKSLKIRKMILGADHLITAYSYNNLASSYDKNKEYDKSNELYQKALKILSNQFGLDHIEVTDIIINLGVNFLRQGQYNKAIEYFHRGIENQLKYLPPNHPNLCNTYFNLGLSYFQNNKIDSAILFFKKDLETQMIYQDHSQTKFYETVLYLMRSYNCLNQFNLSKILLNTAISEMKKYFFYETDQSTIIQYQYYKLPIIEMAINLSFLDLCYSKSYSSSGKILDYSELAHANLLNYQSKSNEALTFSSIPDSLTQKEYKLRVETNWQEKQKQGLLNIGKVETDPEVLNISSIIFDLKRSQEELINLFEKEYPDYYYLKYDTKTISLEETRNSLLKQGETLLEYFVGDSNIYAFVVRPDTFHVEQIKLDFNLDSLVKQLQTGLYGYYGVPVSKRLDAVYKSSLSDYDNAANELYQRIIAPIQTYLTRDVIIVPDGVLGYVPFDALIKSKPIRTGDFKTYQYMINDHNISYTYSATLLKQMRDKKHKKTPTKSLVAFAPFFRGSYVQLDTTIKLVFDTLDDGRDTTIFENYVTRKDYTELPSSGEEVKSASALWKGDYYINTDATEQKFYDVAGDYKIVHLSTHGVADTRQRDYSYLTFSEIKDSIENEYLYVRDIYNTQLNADLVVLSACETAQGELQRGEGIISLARAFAYAGVKSIITTLWVVDDKATKDIMRDFYIELKKGKTKANSLRNAKLKYLQTAKKPNRHPFFWGSFIPLGDMQEIK